MTEHRLDLRGLKCPLPAIRTRAALDGLPPGDRLVVECTDPLSVIDLPNLVRELGDELEGQDRLGRVMVFRMRRTVRGSGG